MDSNLMLGLFVVALIVIALGAWRGDIWLGTARKNWGARENTPHTDEIVTRIRRNEARREALKDGRILVGGALDYATEHGYAAWKTRNNATSANAAADPLVLGMVQLEGSLRLLDPPMKTAASAIRAKVKDWDLGNPGLLVTLGYLYGWIDAAYQGTTPQQYDEAFVGSLFNTGVTRYLSDIAGVEAYLAFSAIPVEGGSTIGGLQGHPPFDAGTLAGGSDFLALIRSGGVPASLPALLLVSDRLA